MPGLLDPREPQQPPVQPLLGPYQPPNLLDGTRALMASIMAHKPLGNVGGRISIGDVAKQGLEFSPGIGDLMSAVDAVNYAKEGRPWMAGLSGLGAIPIIGAVGDIMGKGAKVSSKIYQAQGVGAQGRYVDDLLDKADAIWGARSSPPSGISYLKPNGAYTNTPRNSGGHGDIISVFETGEVASRNDAVRQFINRTGSARVINYPGEYLVEARKNLGKEQIDSIIEHAEGKSITIDIVDDTGKTVDTLSSDSWRSRDIRDFFAKWSDAD